MPEDGNLSGDLQNAVKKQLVSRIAKKYAYKIGSSVKEGAGATLVDIVNAMRGDDPKDYPELKAYLYGPESIGMKPFEGKTNGPEFNSAGKSVREYSDVINPDNEFVFPEHMRDILGIAADAGSNIYINSDKMPYVGDARYDAANHPVRLFRDKDGNIVGSAADIYDFDKDYSRRYSAPAIEARLMRMVGEPYVVRQDNIPFRFVGDDASEEDKMKAQKTMEALGSAERPVQKNGRRDLSYMVQDARSSDDIALDNITQRSGMGLLKQAVVTAERPQYGTNVWDNVVYRYAGGGIIERYGADAVRSAIAKIRGRHKFDGNSEPTGKINRGGGYFMTRT